jgi:4-hydroxybenzoate polyprenyltransferase/phosphoserine phosphatase
MHLNESSLAAPAALPPLVVDLDGTLLATDSLVESVVALLRRRPWMLFLVVSWLFAGRAVFKEKVAAHHHLAVQHLPWRTDLLGWLQAQCAAGRPVWLATAAHRQIADDVAKFLPFFSGVLATDGARNLKGSEKLAEIQRRIGPSFVYAGDSSADLPIWKAASAAVLVGVSHKLATDVRASGIAVEREFMAAPGGARVWLKAIRVHQWVKNVLIFVPLLTSFSFFDLQRVGAALLAFVAFSLAASGTYLLNDLWDLDNDRQHARKRERPLASGALPLGHGVAAAAALLLVALSLAAYVSGPFAAMLAGYVVLTTAYSWMLKSYVLMDVLVLALLYTYRVLAGAVVIEVRVTPWLLAFSVFTFLSLALVKRCAELVALAQAGKSETQGRDYRVSDLVVLWPLGVGASLCSVVVFGLFLATPQAATSYGEGSLLWLVGVGLIYWMARMWIKTSRGEMHDDPIVFALKDRGSRVAVVFMALLPVLVHLQR